MNVYYEVLTKYNIPFNELIDGIKKVSKFGLALNESSILVGMIYGFYPIKNGGLCGDILYNILVRVYKKSALNLLHKLGIACYDLNNQLLRPVDLIKSIGSKFNNLDSIQQQLILAQFESIGCINSFEILIRNIGANK